MLRRGERLKQMKEVVVEEVPRRLAAEGEGRIAGTYTQAISLKSQGPTPHNWSLIACHAESGGQLNR